MPDFPKTEISNNAEIELTKNENGFFVTLNGKHSEPIKQDVPTIEYPEIPSINTNVIEGDCIKYLNEQKVSIFMLPF
jgi:hypothetical protein